MAEAIANSIGNGRGARITHGQVSGFMGWRHNNLAAQAVVGLYKGLPIGRPLCGVQLTALPPPSAKG